MPQLQSSPDPHDGTPEAPPLTVLEPRASAAARPAGGGPANRWVILGLTAFVAYFVASFWPGGWNWGLHALGYFPAAARLASLLICLLLLLPPAQAVLLRVVAGFARPFLSASPAARWRAILPSALAYALFYSFPIRTTAYGDTRTILQWYSDNTQLPVSWLPRLFDVHLLGSKETLTILLHRTIAHVFNLSITEAYRIVGASCGALYILLWFQYVRSATTSSWRPLLLLLGCSMGALGVFFGHVENYAFVLLLAVSFLMAGSRSAEGRMSLGAVCLLFVFAVKAHAMLVFFAPALLYLACYKLAKKFSALRPLLTWKGLTMALILPSLALGAALYFFYFRSFNAPHTGTSGALRQTFLALLPQARPLDYSLGSIAHLLDLVNVLLLVAGPVVLLLIGIALSRPQSLAWHHPSVKFAALGALYPVLFYCALNPALSLPRDWDLYAVLAGPLLVFASAVLLHSHEDRIPRASALGTAMAFGVFAVAFWVLNASPAALSRRLQDVGEYVFRTYHTSSSFLIESALMMEPDANRKLLRRVESAVRLKGVAVRDDEEYSHLLSEIARAYRARGDRDQAVKWAEEAAACAPNDVSLSLWLADYLLWAEHPQRAGESLSRLLDRDPRNVEALVLAAVASAIQDDLDATLRYLERASAIAPNNRDVIEWTALARKKLARRGSVPL